MSFLEAGSADTSRGRLRYAVVGLGHIAQSSVLPAFANARRNSRLTAFVSDDPAKVKKLSRKYGVEHVYSYEDYESALRSGHFEAVFIALPNNLHADFTVRAAQAGMHVLCEKPMAVTSAECRSMIEAARANRIKLMIAYRLHLEAANLKAIEIARSGKLGDLRFFHSVFSFQIQSADNIRVRREMGGGTLYDIGVYCINAARYLFHDEPYEVFGVSANNGDERFREVDEMTSAILRFPGERLASFTTSFGAGAVSSYRHVGANGDLRVEPAYEHREALVHHLTINGRTSEKTFKNRDQFAAELVYFSNCVLRDENPEPSGEEGLADVQIVEALHRSIAEGKPVSLRPEEKQSRPEPGQEIKPGKPSRPKAMVNVQSPTGG